MGSAITNSRTIEITGMSGEGCVQRVSTALVGVPGVSIKSVTLGAAAIGADQQGCNAACIAIGVAGYPARERLMAMPVEPGDPVPLPLIMDGKLASSAMMSPFDAARAGALVGAASGSAGAACGTSLE